MMSMRHLHHACAVCAPSFLPQPLLPLCPALLLQGVACLGLGTPQVSSLLVEITNLAAFDSLVAGMLPPLTRRALDNLLASVGWVAGSRGRRARAAYLV